MQIEVKKKGQSVKKKEFSACDSLLFHFSFFKKKRSFYFTLLLKSTTTLFWAFHLKYLGFD